MMDDCYSPEDQQKFIKGLKEFSEYAKKTINKSFAKATPEEREKVLKSIEEQKRYS